MLLLNEDTPSAVPTISEYLEWSGIPPKERAYTRASMPPHLEPYRENVVRALNKGRSVILSGPPGRGKTGLAVVGLRSLAEEALKAAREVEDWSLPRMAYFYIPDYIKQLRRSVGGAESPEPRGCEASYLILDDLGQGYHTDFGTAETAYLIHHRLLWCRPTVLTTAMSPAGVEAQYGKSFMSRLKEFYHVRLPEELPDLREER
jgi:DNA replication protein DnaC